MQSSLILTQQAPLCAESTGDSAVGSVKAKAEVLLRSGHAAERMLRCWGSGAGLVFEDTRDAIKKLIAVRSNVSLGLSRINSPHGGPPWGDMPIVVSILPQPLASVVCSRQLSALLSGSSPEAYADRTQEAVSSRDMGEARTCLRSLAVPFFHHELVKQALLAAMEDAAAAVPLLDLLKSLADSADVSPLQMQKVTRVTLFSSLLDRASIQFCMGHCSVAL